ncbi:hypothetical protein ACEPAI_3561 [Sanghuangporus weigelae]
MVLTERSLERLLVLVKASRIPGWCFGPILYTIGVINSGILPKSIPSILCTGVQLFCLSFPLCIVVFGVNDVYDYASDIRNPRKQGWSLEGCVLEPTHHDFVLAAAFISHFHTTSINNRYSYTRLVILLTTASTQGRPILDSLSNGILVWLCWALGYTSSGYTLFGPNAGEGVTKGWLLALCTSGVHALGAAVDVEVDNATGQRTIATAYGKRAAAFFSAML